MTSPRSPARAQYIWGAPPSQIEIGGVRVGRGARRHHPWTTKVLDHKGPRLYGFYTTGVLEHEENEEGHHQGEERDGFRQGEAQNGIAEELLRQGRVTSHGIDQGAKDNPDSGTRSRQGDGGTTSTDKFCTV